MKIKITANDYDKVLVDGEQKSQHRVEEEAVESAINAAIENPDAKVLVVPATRRIEIVERGIENGIEGGITPPTTPPPTSTENYTGTFAHGNSVIIHGSGFGTKPTDNVAVGVKTDEAVPLLWDTVDNIAAYTGLVDGNQIPVGSGYPWVQNKHLVKYSESTEQRHARSVAQYYNIDDSGGSPTIINTSCKLGWIESLYPGGVTWIGSRTKKLFASYWFRSSLNISNTNTKTNRVWIDSEGADPRLTFQGDQVYGGSGSCSGYAFNIWWNTTNGYNNQYQHDGWNRMDFWVDYEGYVDYRLNGQIIHANSGFNYNEIITWDGWCSGSSHTGTRWYPTGYNTYPNCFGGMEIPNQNAANAMSGLEYRWSDFYADDCWMRVEIGDNADYSSCTHLEIQPTTAWADTNITITVNQGSFSSLTGKYIHVLTDSPDGTLSNDTRSVAKSFAI